MKKAIIFVFFVSLIVSLLTHLSPLSIVHAQSSPTYSVVYKQAALGRADNNNSATASFHNSSYVVDAKNLLAVTVSSKGPNSQVTSVTDNYNNTYTKVIESSTSDGTAHISLWYTIPQASNTGYVFTASTQGVPATTKLFMNVQDLSGVDTNNPVVAANKAQGTNAALNTGAISAPLNSYILAGYTFSDNAAISWNGFNGPNGYSDHHRNLDGVSMAPMILMSTGGLSTNPNPPTQDYNAAFTLPNNQTPSWAGFIAAFKAAGQTSSGVCDPDPTGSSQGKLDNQDLAVIRNELLGLLVSNKGACLNNAPNNTSSSQTDNTALARIRNILLGLENPPAQ